jgi:hypothetical protein
VDEHEPTVTVRFEHLPLGHVEQHGVHTTSNNQSIGKAQSRCLTVLDHLHPPSSDHDGSLNLRRRIAAFVNVDGKSEASLAVSREPL